MIATIAVALGLTTPAAAPAPLPPTCTARLPADRLEGRWTGPFAQADWTFELTRQGTSWSGRYMSSKGQSWHPLESVTVSGGCVSFSLISEPRLTFVLTLGPDGATLAGDIEVAGHATLPFSARRGS